VREYTEQYYLPAASAYRARAAGQGVKGKQIADWQRELDEHWAAMRLGKVTVEKRGEQHFFEAEVNLNELDPLAVQVELYADKTKDAACLRHEMQLMRQLDGVPGGCVYGAAVSASRPATDYTVRVIPAFAGVSIPLEATHILWQR
jgi:starch phosphorylase